MTIKDAAQKYGVTVQAIYKRLKADNIQVDSIRDKATQQITPDGEAVLMNLFGGEAQEKRATLNQQFASIKAEKEQLSTEVDRLTELVKNLQLQVEELKQDKANLTKALDQAQNLHQQTLNRLLPPAKAEKQESSQSNSAGSAPQQPEATPEKVAAPEAKPAAQPQSKPQITISGGRKSIMGKLRDFIRG